MAKPRKKLPTQVVKIICSACQGLLFKYHKGGNGALVKCFKERIKVDYCKTACQCPHCEQVFGRETLVRGTPAYKIISGKARIK